jgi:hypothetical protein
MARKDYTCARHFAISGIGYGKGFSPAEALDNYVKIQLRNIPADRTIFKTRKAWEEALRSGEAKASVWVAPEGWDGFLLSDEGLSWTREVDGQKEYRKARIEERVTS